MLSAFCYPQTTPHTRCTLHCVEGPGAGFAASPLRGAFLGRTAPGQPRPGVGGAGRQCVTPLQDPLLWHLTGQVPAACVHIRDPLNCSQTVVSLDWNGEQALLSRRLWHTGVSLRGWGFPLYPRSPWSGQCLGPDRHAGLLGSGARVVSGTCCGPWGCS